MRTMLHRLASVLAIALLAGAIAAVPAGADPVNAKNAQLVTVECGDAGTFETVTKGNGDWTPVHDLNSNAVLIPVSFGTTTFTVKDAEGNVVFEETEAARTRGHAKRNGRALIDCTYTLSFPVEEGNTATISGSVTGFVSGHA